MFLFSLFIIFASAMGLLFTLVYSMRYYTKPSSVAALLIFFVGLFVAGNYLMYWSAVRW